MSTTYKKIIKQGLELGNPHGVSAIEISGVGEGLILKQNVGGKVNSIYLDNRTAGALIGGIGEGFGFNMRMAHKGIGQPSAE
jgi:hypothetical protein